jgi:hypothetical protein
MEYKRLTFRHKSVVDGTEQIGYTERIAGCYRASDMILNRLAELEDKIENGTLIELPRIVRIVECSVEKFVVQWEENGRVRHKSFLVEKEAEKRLKELQNKNI